MSGPVDTPLRTPSANTARTTAAAPSPTVHQDFLTVREAAGMLAVHENTVRKWIRAGDLPVWRHGRILRISAADVAVLGVDTELGQGRQHSRPKPARVAGGFTRWAHALEEQTA